MLLRTSVEKESDAALQNLQSEDVGDGTGRQLIRCPLCAWQPSRHDRWQCICLHVWNTFDTRALCPSCGYQWRETQCLKCHLMSPHEAWYVNPESAKR